MELQVTILLYRPHRRSASAPAAWRPHSRSNSLAASLRSGDWAPAATRASANLGVRKTAKRWKLGKFESIIPWKLDHVEVCKHKIDKTMYSRFICLYLYYINCVYSNILRLILNTPKTNHVLVLDRSSCIGGPVMHGGSWTWWSDRIQTCWNIQWIGLRENLQENPIIFMGKSMVSG